jgi:predicted TIM-barrel fold metal-dependent hydrolase
MTDLRLVDYIPVSKLVVPQTLVERPRFPVVDAHNHLGGEFGSGWDQRPVEELLEVMDRAGVEMLVDLDGGWGEDQLNKHLDHFKNKAPRRFQIFGGVDWSKWIEHADRFGEWAAKQFELQIRRGAQGLKVWKILGLHVKDQRENLVQINDSRLDPIWAKAAEFRVPVLIHIADPVAFFDPIDAFNERYEELHQHPDWSFYGPQFPSFDVLMEQFEDLISRHPDTTFVGAHVGCYSENLSWVGKMLDRCPNFYIDIAARISELGRQPYTSRRFFLRYQDRILFGVDISPDLDWYKIYYRFLETEDEYFNYGAEEVPGQGRWYIYGIHLPANVLEKVYQFNARKVLCPQ